MMTRQLTIEGMARVHSASDQSSLVRLLTRLEAAQEDRIF